MHLSHLAYGYDADDNITSIKNQLGPAGSALYGYDTTGRLTFTATDAGPAPGTESYAYGAGTNRLASVTAGSNVRSVSYDGRGNTAAESRPGGVTLSTSYDGYGRLTGYSRSDAAALGFAYNGRDDRIAMVRGGVTRRFVTAPDGRVLGEYGASAADVKAEFIYAAPQVAAGGPFGGDDGVMGYGPLAVATPDAGGTVVINWIHASHLGVPLVTTDAAGAPATTPNDYLLPGFPGQWRVLPDLYFNRHRDYDPATGRYIQADPIGLAGGSNVYGYVGGNPVNAIDPEGLNPWALLRAAVIAGEITGEALVWLCRRFPRECAETIASAAIGVSKALAPSRPAGPMTPPSSNFDRDRDPPKYPPISPPWRSPRGPDDCCEEQKVEDTLRCNDWNIAQKKHLGGYSRRSGFAACMGTVAVRNGECVSRGGPEKITSPLFVPDYLWKRRNK